MLYLTVNCYEKGDDSFMITFKNVNFSYHSPSEEADEVMLTDISMNIKEGECVLLTGASGCGKSTMLKLINGIIPEFVHGSMEGEISVQNKEIQSLGIAERSAFIGSVFQNPKSQFFHLNTTDEVCFGVVNHKVEIEEIHKRYEETIKLFEIEELMNRNILGMSGGEKQQIACASVTMNRPSVYLLDEPSSNLDIDAIHKLRDILLSLKKMGNTIIIAEHRLYYVLEICDRVMYMEKGRILFDETKERFMESYKQKEYGLRSYYGISLDMITKKYYTKMLDGDQDYMEIDEMLVKFHEKIAVNIQNLQIPKHEVIAIVGDNGAGKSSFVRGLVGVQKTKRYMEDKKKRSKKARIKKSYMVMQDVNCQLYAESVLNELLDLTEETEEEVKKAKEILTKLQLIEYAKSHPMALSGGQKQRLAIACALFLKKKVMVFDEPTSGLDYKNMKKVSSILKELKSEVECLLVITHDMELIEQCATYIIEIQNGQVVRQFARKK